MKRVFLLLLLASATTLPARAELGIALSPMRIEIQISAGGQYTESFRLSNESAESVRVRGELLDWYLDDSMTPQFADRYEQEEAFSCRDWLQINPREMDLVGNGTFRVRYTLRVPVETAEGEYHCGAGFVTMPPIQPNQPAMGMFIAVRAVAAFYVVVGNPSSEPAFKDLSLRAAPDGTWEAVAWFENQGLRHYRIRGFVEVLDERGQMVERAEYPSVPVLPKRVQAFPIRLKNSLAPGTYQVRSQADVGLPEILEATTRVVVEGPSRNKQ